MASRKSWPASRAASRATGTATLALRWLAKPSRRLLIALAIHFEGLDHAAPNGNRARREPERRGGLRRLFTIPIRVRQEQVPWFEEMMSLDFSPRGLRFRSHREYPAGQLVRIALEDASSLSWSGSGEFRAKVVRVSPAEGGVALHVAVCHAT